MVADQKADFFKPIHSKLSLVVYPIQLAVNKPIQLVRWLANGITSQQELLNENARLRAHEFLLEAKLQKLLTLERENAQLKELLKSTTHVTGKVVVAQILAVDLDPNLERIVLNKGTRQKVYVGQPVLDAYGVFGQVVGVGPLTSQVMLITDPKIGIPVKDNRSGVRAIAVGEGDQGTLLLINVPTTSDVKAGDLFVTSGLGFRYPVGYPVGRVVSVNTNRGKPFMGIVIEPEAHLDKSQQVLLAWPEHQAFIKAVKQQLNKNQEQ